jgi:hypothetical protein
MKCCSWISPTYLVIVLYLLIIFLLSLCGESGKKKGTKYKWADLWKERDMQNKSEYGRPQESGKSWSLAVQLIQFL